MSVSLGKAREGGRKSRGIGANLATGFALLVRARRFKTSRLLPPARRLGLGALAGVALVLLAMEFLDARGVTFAHTLPSTVVDTFNEITDFGQSGWFLVPLAILVALTVLLATPAAGRIGSIVLAS